MGNVLLPNNYEDLISVEVFMCDGRRGEGESVRGKGRRIDTGGEMEREKEEEGAGSY